MKRKQPTKRTRDLEAAQRRLDASAHADVLEAIRQGLDDVTHGRTRPAREIFAEMRNEYGIGRQARGRTSGRAGS
jgi:hypothetical protein